MTRRSLLILSVCLAALFLVGCGYTLVGLASNIPEDVRRVYVEALENQTARAQVDQILTDALISELVTRRRFDLVNAPDEADAVLRGAVVGFNVRPLTFDNNGLADNFEIAITADMRFQRVPQADQDEGDVIWRNARYAFRQDYELEASGANFFDREQLAIEETAEDFAQTLVTDLLEGF
ncbi:MAG: LPS assembly lipoprotein LptE [Acidobacteriota bacterium]